MPSAIRSIGLVIALAIVGLLVAARPCAAQSAVPSAFTYQGKLTQNAQPYTGTADFQFRLYNGQIITTQVGATVSRNNIQVDKGVFSTTLDFGPEGASLNTPFIEISVRTPAGTADPYTVLSPRQPITPTPVALALEGLNRTGTITPDQFQLTDDTTFSAAANVTQSFILSRSGEVASIQLKLVNTTASPITVPLTVRSNFTLFAFLSGVAQPGTSVVDFSFPRGTTLTNVQTLFIDFNTTSQLGVRYATGNPYAAGTSNIGGTFDLYFSVNFRTSGAFSSELPLAINTASAFPLTINGSTSAGAGIQLGSSAFGGTQWTMVATANDATEGAFKLRLTNAIAAAGSGLTVDVAGRLGINQISPQSTLHVGGDVRVDGAITIADASRIWTTPASAFVATTAGAVTVPADLTVQGATASQVVALTAPLNLPEGATITRMRGHAIDNSTTNDISFSLIALSKTSTTNVSIASVSSSSNSSAVRTFDVLPPSPHTVTNGTNAYLLRVSWITPTTLNEIRLRAVTIEYTVDSPLP